MVLEDVQASWDRQQAEYLPDREYRFGVVLELVEAMVGDSPLVLDLACGPGSITSRLLQRLPNARVVGVDLDPALLEIARGVFAEDQRVDIRAADLADPAWTAAVCGTRFDAVLTATALHWLGADDLRRLYGDLAGLIRVGGVFANVDHMPAGQPDAGIAEAVEAFRRKQWTSPDPWAAWWSILADDPALGTAVAERRAIFTARPPQEFTPPVDWHLRALREAGFSEVTEVWRSHQDALVAAVP